MKRIFLYAALLLCLAGSAGAQTYHDLSSGNLTENWSNTGLITANDNWSGVASIRGFLGSGLAAAGTDPQTVTAADDPGTLDVNANQTNPNTFTTGGVTEFDGIANPSIALQGSNTAQAPYIKLYLNTTGRQAISINFNAIDLDGSTDNAVQQLAVQYRVGSSGAFTNIPAGFVADATLGPSLSGLTTAVAVVLPGAAENQAQVEVRIITVNAAGNDEWIGIDDIVVSSAVLPVTFSRFNAVFSNNNTQLSWTANATNGNSTFSAERSTDGRSFTTLTTLPAQTGERQYTYTDVNVAASPVYYRILFMENGNRKYTDIIKITGASKQALALSRLYNDNSNSLQAEIYSDRAAMATVSVSDMNGKKMMQQNMPLLKGTQVLNITLPELNKGMYIFTVSNGSETVTRKWMK